MQPMDYSSLSGTELVRAFNSMAESTTGRELGVRPVNRFANLDIGRQRCQQLASSIQARSDGLIEVDAEEILELFKTNIKKNRGKLLARLYGTMNAQVSFRELLDAVYSGGGNKNSILMVMRGLQMTISKKRLPYCIEKRKAEGELSYGLYSSQT
jgi:hypothetical protein